MKLNRKNKLLLLGICLVLYLCYAFAISKTIAYYKEYSSQKQLLSNNFNNPAITQSLLLKEKQLNDLLGQYSASTGDFFQNELLKQLSHLSDKNNLKIIDFKEPHVFVEKDLKTLSYTFSLEGSFNGILLLLNSVENNPSLGNIKHLSFIKKRNYKNNTDYLTVDVILQKSEPIKST